MPIRFRCVYCDKLLGIARRKAGAVVNCPQCGQPLIVPSPVSEPQPAATVPPSPPAPGAPAPTYNANKLFEQDNFDVLLEPDHTYQNPVEPEPPARRDRKGRPEPAAALPPRPFAVEHSLPTPSDRYPAPIPLPAARPGIVLTTGRLVLALVVVGVLLLGAFGAGLLVGRAMN